MGAPRVDPRRERAVGVTEVFSRRYAVWAGVVSAAVILFGGILPLSGAISPRLGAAATATVFVPAAVGLFLIGARAFPGNAGHPAAHLLTAVRGIAGAALLVSTATGGATVPSWRLVAVLAAVETTDFFDGRTARRLGSGPFGATWDMENDAFFTFALSYTLWATGTVPAFVLVLGWMRYLFFLAARTQGPPPGQTPAFTWFAKTTAAAIVVVLISVFAPPIGRTLRIVAVAIVLAMQLASFGWEALLILRAGGSAGE